MVHTLSNSAGLGFGGFLLGLGLGWLIFRAVEISPNVFAWLLVIVGAGIVLSSLLSWGRPKSPIRGMVGGLMGGLILSLFLTSGFAFIEDITGIGWEGIGGPYRLERTRAFTGEADEDTVYLKVENRNGPIHVSTWEKSEYKVELNIKARGASDDEAMRTIEGLDIDLVEEVLQERMRLVLDYNIPSETWRKLSIGVNVVLPADAVIDLDLGSSNGAIHLTDVEGVILRVETSNGQLVFNNVYAESITGKTSNGAIEGEVEAMDTVLSTSNGRIGLTIPCTFSGEYDLSTSNGAIEITVSPSEQVGYDLDLDTSISDIDINLPNLEYTRKDKTRKIAQTTGFETKEVQITIEADTSLGKIDVSTS